MFNEIWSRVKREAGLSNFRELSEIIGITEAAISKQRKKDTFLPQWAFKIGQQFGISTEWIMTGRPPKRFSEITTNEFAVKLGCWIDEYSKDDPRKAGAAELKVEEALPEFKEWLDEQDKSRRTKAA
ncbi:MAG: hypothetical protein Q3M24_16505 [Candidatus Electrothrix aestuarii]|uniref:Bacteriophage CI repressor helix-turn-helix domain-containing protein n=1 Tax=Candidatus Electrothrix aestuarii TaxID=3062594 RepID=A0AAU8LSK4_9BACT|nr:hypothetical protein [Candidatus Electrothrix aestuarii]